MDFYTLQRDWKFQNLPHHFQIALSPPSPQHGPMKTLHALGLVAAAVAITLAIEESRIAALRGDKADGIVAGPGKSGDTPGTGQAAAGKSTSPVPVRGKAAERSVPEAISPREGGGDESLGKTVRKMWENPAGKAMMNQGVKMAVAMMYEDFIGGLELSEEEEEYFKTLLGRDIADQQEIGLKMMNATPEERAALAKEIEARAKENKESIKAFLNSDEDFERFTGYQDRLPERQQLDGIRAAFAAKQTPLDEAAEAKLVEAMYQARTTANTPNFTGPDAFTQMNNGNLAGEFEKSWDVQEAALMKEVGGILDEPQMSAFKEYRGQLKEMQLMSIKMYEKMMSDGSGGK